MIDLKLPTNSKPRNLIQRFSAPFLLGQYDFSIAANNRVTLAAIEPSSVYVVQSYQFSANCPADAWFAGLPSAAAGIPRWQLAVSGDKNPNVYPEAVKTTNFTPPVEYLAYFQSQKQGAVLQMTFEGVILGGAGLVGIDPLVAQVEIIVYQVTETEWIKRYIAGTLPQF